MSIRVSSARGSLIVQIHTSATALSYLIVVLILINLSLLLFQFVKTGYNPSFSGVGGLEGPLRVLPVSLVIFLRLLWDGGVVSCRGSISILRKHCHLICLTLRDEVRDDKDDDGEDNDCNDNDDHDEEHVVLLTLSLAVVNILLRLE